MSHKFRISIFFVLLVFLLNFTVHSHEQHKLLRIATTRNSRNGTLQRNVSPAMREQFLLERFAAEKKCGYQYN